jgi:hypothetical protein
MKRRFRFILMIRCALLALLGANLSAQVVSVTMTLDKPQISAGESTILHVFARIVPAQRPSTDRIFSWYVDLTGTNEVIAKPNWSTLAKPVSDKNPQTSSFGVMDGLLRRGIYDTFINLPAAGRDTAVELCSVQIDALTPGKSTFAVQHGTGASGLSADFIVAPAGGGAPLLGADYSQASVELTVSASAAPNPALAITSSALAAQTGLRITLNYSVRPGANHFVEASDKLGPAASWLTVPGGPHQSGTYTDTNSLRQRFYRLRIQ